MKIAFVHYLIGDRAGINSVMRTNIISLTKLYKDIEIFLVGHYIRDLVKSKNIKYIHLPELDITKDKKIEYSKQDIFMYMENGEFIYNKLFKVLDDMDYIIFENPTLGIHPAATYAFYRFTKKNKELERKTKIIYRIHDFAEDRRGNFIDLLKFEGGEQGPYWHKILFPKLRNLGYVVINSPDVKRIKSHGLIEENKVFYLPNPIDESLMEKDKKTGEKLRELLIKKEGLADDVKFIFYPVRIVPRKNVEEAIFLTVLINFHFNQNYHLIVSLKEPTEESKKYARILERFVKENKLPVTIGINEYVTLKRTWKNGKIKTFGIADAYNICDKVITTSLLEGFGMFFIESWFYEKSIIGRDLPEITPDFKSKGINLEHLYSALFIEKKDFKDIGNLKHRLRLILKLKNKKFRTKFYEENKHQLDGMFRLFDKDQEQNLIKINKKQVIKHFSSDYIARQFIKSMKLIV